MATPSTPKKQVRETHASPSAPRKNAQSMKPEQLLTPPLTAAARNGTSHSYCEPGPHIRRLTYDERPRQAEVEGLSSSPHVDPLVYNTPAHQVKAEELTSPPPIRRFTYAASTIRARKGFLSPGHHVRRLTYDTPITTTQQKDLSSGPTPSNSNDGRPTNEVKYWIYSSTNPEQRRKRFQSVLHSLWPSNDNFNSARDPLYEPVEDGPYEFFLTQIWDGHCPYFDDDYNPAEDPARSTEVWQPKIGDEAIENEIDLQMVLKARQEHRARSDALKERKSQVIDANLRAGVKYVDIDMAQVLLGPEIESSDSDIESSDSDSDSKLNPDYNDEDNSISQLATQNESSSGITNAIRSASSLQPIIAAKGIRVFCGQEPSVGATRRRGSNNKRKRRRGLNENLDKTYKYDSDSEDERPLRRKAKRGKVTIGTAIASDQAWKAQTRAATRRARHI